MCAPGREGHGALAPPEEFRRARTTRGSGRLACDATSPDRGQHGVEHVVTAVQAGFHAGLQHPVALLRRVEEAHHDDARSTRTRPPRVSCRSRRRGRASRPTRTSARSARGVHLRKRPSKPSATPSWYSTNRQWPPRSTSRRTMSSRLPRPHHWATRSGSVIARQTCSRGASNTRSTRISRSDGRLRDVAAGAVVGSAGHLGSPFVRSRNAPSRSRRASSGC